GVGSAGTDTASGRGPLFGAGTAVAGETAVRISTTPAIASRRCPYRLAPSSAPTPETVTDSVVVRGDRVGEGVGEHARRHGVVDGHPACDGDRVRRTAGGTGVARDLLTRT